MKVKELIKRLSAYGPDQIVRFRVDSHDDNGEEWWVWRDIDRIAEIKLDRNKAPIVCIVSEKEPF